MKRLPAVVAEGVAALSSRGRFAAGSQNAVRSSGAAPPPNVILNEREESLSSVLPHNQRTGTQTKH